MSKRPGCPPDSAPLLSCLQTPTMSLSFPGHLKTFLNVTFFWLLAPLFQFLNKLSSSPSQGFPKAIPSDRTWYKLQLCPKSTKVTDLSRGQADAAWPVTALRYTRLSHTASQMKAQTLSMGRPSRSSAKLLPFLSSPCSHLSSGSPGSPSGHPHLLFFSATSGPFPSRSRFPHHV